MTQTTVEVLLLVLNGLILPIVAWVLLTVVKLGNGSAASAVWRESRDHELVDLRARVVRCEEGLTALQLDFAKMTSAKKTT